MYDQNNVPDLRPGYRLAASTTCPIPSGEVGMWLDGTATPSVRKWRNADGTDKEEAGSTTTYGPARLVDTSVLTSANYDYAAGVWTHKSNNTQLTIDSVAPALNDRVLRVFGDAQDGIYSYTRLNGASIKAQWTRAADLNSTDDFIGGAVAAASAGTVYANTLWELSLPSPFVMDTQTPVFTQTATAVTAAAVLAGLAAAAGDINVNTQKITNVVDPTAAQGAATKHYVDGASVAHAGVQAGTPSATAAPAFTGTAPIAAENVTPVFTGTGCAAAGQVITTTDTQTMTLNQCAGMWFVSDGTPGNCALILSNTAVVGAVAVLTVAGFAQTAAGDYRIFKGMTPIGVVAAVPTTTHTHIQVT